MKKSEFKEKARRLLFNSNLKDFPIVFEMYVLSLGLSNINLDMCMGEILTIIRTSTDSGTAYTMVCHYLDELEQPKT
jgi:hypothetical protein